MGEPRRIDADKRAHIGVSMNRMSGQMRWMIAQTSGRRSQRTAERKIAALLDIARKKRAAAGKARVWWRSKRTINASRYKTTKELHLDMTNAVEENSPINSNGTSPMRLKYR